MINELQYIDELKTDGNLFEKKFSALHDYYIFKDGQESEIHDFIHENPGVLLLLDEVKPYLDEHFADGEYLLRMSYDTDIDFDKVVLMVNVSRERFYDDIGEDIKTILFGLWPLRKRINVLSELLIMPGVLDV